jgi:hypothetical protein
MGTSAATLSVTTIGKGIREKRSPNLCLWLLVISISRFHTHYLSKENKKTKKKKKKKKQQQQ